MAGRRANHEGTKPRRHASGGWFATIRDSRRGKRIWIYGATQREVLAKLQQEAERIRIGGQAPEERTTNVRQWAATWLQNQDGRVAPSTAKRYRELLTLYVVPEVGSLRLTELRPADVDHLLRKASRDLAPASVNRVREAFRNCLNEAIRYGLLDRNVAAQARGYKVPHHESGYLTITQARQLLASLAGHPFEALFTVGLAVGLRPAEVLGLRWRDVTLDETPAVLRVRKQWKPGLGLVDPKRSTSLRDIPMPQALVEQLASHRARQAEARLGAKAWERTDLVFTTAAGRPLNLVAVRRAFTRALEASDLGVKVKLYEATRHTAASLMAAQGIGPRTAQAILGHANLETTLSIYTHVGWDDKVAAAAAIQQGLVG